MNKVIICDFNLTKSHILTINVKSHVFLSSNFKSVFGIYTSVKFNSAKFDSLFAIEHYIVFRKQKNGPSTLNSCVMNNEQITFKLWILIVLL